MKNFFLLQKNKFKRFLSIFKKGDWVKILVFLGFIVVGLILGGMTYAFTRGSLLFLQVYPQFMRSMGFYLLSSWFFLIFILTFASGFVSSFGLLFNQDDDQLLLSLPFRIRTIFKSRLVDLLFVSSWPVIVFGIPLLLAFKQSFLLSWSSFGFSFLGLVLILIIAMLLAAMISLKLISLLGFVNKKLIYFFGLIGLPVAAVFIVNLLMPPGLMEAFRDLKFAEISNYIQSLPISSRLLPSNWAVNLSFYWQKQPQFALLNLSRLILLIIGLGSLLYLLVKRNYFQALAKNKQGCFIAGPQDQVKKKPAKKHFPYFFKGVDGAFIEKDSLSLIRNSRELLQVGLFIFIIVLYFFSFSRIPVNNLHKRLPDFSELDLVKLNFVFTLHIFSVFALRFIYPLISLEGQMAWMVWVAPFKKTTLFKQKLGLWMFLLGMLSVVMSGVSTLILGQNIVFWGLQSLVLFLGCIAIVSVNLGMGALLPNFAEKNPEKISTSSGGLITTVLSIGYVLFWLVILNNRFFSFQSLQPGYLLFGLSSLLILMSSFFFFRIQVKRYEF
jgi:ABC-2 type transport system permease protein